MEADKVWGGFGAGNSAIFQKKFATQISSHFWVHFRRPSIIIRTRLSQFFEKIIEATNLVVSVKYPKRTLVTLSEIKAFLGMKIIQSFHKGNFIIHKIFGADFYKIHFFWLRKFKFSIISKIFSHKLYCWHRN